QSRELRTARGQVLRTARISGIVLLETRTTQRHAQTGRQSTMTTAEHADDRVISASEVADPYALHLDYARSAPSTLGARFKYLGPGMLMSAAVVGSGELITTTSMGSKAGFALMWLIIVSTAAKLFIQMELAK